MPPYSENKQEEHSKVKVATIVTYQDFHIVS